MPDKKNTLVEIVREIAGEEERKKKEALKEKIRLNEERKKKEGIKNGS